MRHVGGRKLKRFASVVDDDRVERFHVDNGSLQIDVAFALQIGCLQTREKFSSPFNLRKRVARLSGVPRG